MRPASCDLSHLFPFPHQAEAGSKDSEADPDGVEEEAMGSGVGAAVEEEVS